MNLRSRIEKMKKQFGYRIVSHYFTTEEVHEVSDFIGDSLEIIYDVKKHEHNPTIMCSTFFMVETAKLLNPKTEILTPVQKCNCDMVFHLKEKDITLARNTYPNTPLVLYFNSPMHLKPFADALCTTSCAINVIESFDSQVVLFGPDKNIASYLKNNSNKNVISICNGYCYAHQYEQEEIKKMLKRYPEACVVMHPECPLHDYADYIGGTSGIRKYVRDTNHKVYIIGSESSLAKFIQQENPEKVVLPLSEENTCHEMKKFNQCNIYESIVNQRYKVNIELKKREADYVKELFLSLRSNVPGLL